MPRAFGRVQGDLLSWARRQQEVTMRWVMAHGGPSPGYQSEVEAGKKTEVLSDMLSQWVALLGVTEAFARGQIPQYRIDPAGCRGLAADVGMSITASPLDSWNGMSIMERAREVLRRIAYESRILPRVVLAWVLGLQVTALDGLISGEHLITAVHLRAIAELTTIPEIFFTTGEFHSDMTLLETYLPAVRMAVRLGISPHQLCDVLDCLQTVAKQGTPHTDPDRRR